MHDALRGNDAHHGVLVLNPLGRGPILTLVHAPALVMGQRQRLLVILAPPEIDLSSHASPLHDLVPARRVARHKVWHLLRGEQVRALGGNSSFPYRAQVFAQPLDVDLVDAAGALLILFRHLVFGAALAKVGRTVDEAVPVVSP
jgi:hypothetical protein